MRGLPETWSLNLGTELKTDLFKTLDFQEGQNPTPCFPRVLLSSSRCHPENTAKEYFLSSPVETFSTTGHPSISQAWAEPWRLKQIIGKWPVVCPSLPGIRGDMELTYNWAPRVRWQMGLRNFQQANFYVSFSLSYKSRQAFNVGRKRKEAGRHTFHSFFL